MNGSHPFSALRGALSVIVYALVAELLIMGSNIVQGVLFEIQTISGLEALHHLAQNLAQCAAQIFPGAVLIGVAVHLAPRNRVRWAVLPAAAAMATLWNLVCADLYGDAGAAFPEVLEFFLTALLVAFVCDWHRSAQGAADQLLRTQIEALSLDTEFNRARLSLLRAQIEPHFLFNTLATVRVLARNDRKSAGAMIDNLLRYFSAALPKMRRDESPLAEELELVEAYLRIHQVRMGARLSYEVCSPDSLRNVHVPTMMLLTLVENAIKHGINPAVAGGVIQVKAVREESAIALHVSDSGRGMQLRHSHGTGLANVRTRLTLLYGQSATLALRSLEPHGVEATIKIPYAAFA